MFTAEYTLDLDDLLKTVIIETADLAVLVDEKIIIMDFELVVVVALQLCHSETLHVTEMDNISFRGHRHHYVGASCSLSCPFVALTLITGSTTTPYLKPPINSPFSPHLVRK